MSAVRLAALCPVPVFQAKCSERIAAVLVEVLRIVGVPWVFMRRTPFTDAFKPLREQSERQRTHNSELGFADSLERDYRVAGSIHAGAGCPRRDPSNRTGLVILKHIELDMCFPR